MTDTLFFDVYLTAEAANPYGRSRTDRNPPPTVIHCKADKDDLGGMFAEPIVELFQTVFLQYITVRRADEDEGIATIPVSSIAYIKYLKTNEHGVTHETDRSTGA